MIEVWVAVAMAWLTADAPNFLTGKVVYQTLEQCERSRIRSDALLEAVGGEVIESRCISFQVPVRRGI